MRVPASRERLLRQIQFWVPALEATVAVEPTPFAAVQVDENACSACGLCAKVCPTQALRLEIGAPKGDDNRALDRAAVAEEQRPWQLSFRPVACIDCGICAQACPEGAINYGGWLPAATLCDGESVRIGGRLTTCASCGAAVALRGSQRPVCYACRRGAARSNPQADPAGLMADLSKRASPG